MEMPRITSYSGSVHPRISLCITAGSLNLFFSCGVAIAFEHPSTGLVCMENRLGGPRPHGRHLNAIEPDYTKRVTEDEFGERLQGVLECGIL